MSEEHTLREVVEQLMDDLSLNPVPGSKDMGPNPIWAACDLNRYDANIRVDFVFETVAARDHARNFGGHELIKVLLRSALEVAGMSNTLRMRLWAKEEWGDFRPATDADHQAHIETYEQLNLTPGPHRQISRGLICEQDKYKLKGPLHTLMEWDSDGDFSVFDEYTRDELDAFSAGFLPKLKALLDDGADPNERAPLNYTVPISHPLAWYLPGVMKVLLDAGAQPDVDLDAFGTPITYMIRTNLQGHVHGSDAKAKVFLEALQELARAGADMNLVGSNNLTPLFRAIQYKRPEIVSLLLELGADPSIEDEKGRDALEYAIACGNKNIVELLATSDEQRESANKRMDNPPHLEIIQTLIARLKTRKERLRFILPGFKYEYEDEFEVSWCNGGWFAVEYDGYKRHEEPHELGASDADLQNYIQNKLRPGAPLQDSWQKILGLLGPTTLDDRALHFPEQAAARPPKAHTGKWGYHDDDCMCMTAGPGFCNRGGSVWSCCGAIEEGSGCAGKGRKHHSAVSSRSDVRKGCRCHRCAPA